MSKGRGIILGLMAVIFSVSACGKGDAVSDTTELLEVEEGIVFQTLEDEVLETTEMDIAELVLTAEDIEGMNEKSTALVKYTKIYAKPSTSAAVIGEGGRGEKLGVYGKLETGEWYVVSYNGRVGYVQENCIKQEDVENIISMPEEEDTPNRETTNSNSNHGNVSNNNESQTPSNDETTPPSNNQTQQPDNSGNQALGNGENTMPTPDNSETQSPSSSESETLDNGESIKPENSEAQEPENSENIGNSESATQNPDSNGNEGNTTSNPDNDGTQNPSSDESETPDNSEAELPEAGGAQTPEQNNSESPDK